MALLLHTPGEPGGIGIECLLKLIREPHPYCRVALSDPALIEAQAAALDIPVHLQLFDGEPRPTPAGVLYVESLPPAPAAATRYHKSKKLWPSGSEVGAIRQN